MSIDLETFRQLPIEQIAQLVRQAGPKVCVFPINGTRRWFMLEYPAQRESEFAAGYLQVIIQRHVELYQIFFDCGIHTLLTPAFGPDLLERGPEYIQMSAEGLEKLCADPIFLDFCRAYQVRVRFYGDYATYLPQAGCAHLLDTFEQLVAQTMSYDRHRLFLGLFAHDATETVAELAVRYYNTHGRVPDKHTLTELYYGEYVEPVDLFIGFDRFAAFDMPLVAVGSEDLYFTVCPSPYFSREQLLDILYDHLYARKGEPDYEAMDDQDWTLMRRFYQANSGHTQGIGTAHKGIWYPQCQVNQPVDPDIL